MSQLFENNAASRLSADIAADALSFTITSGDGALFPSPVASVDHFLVTLENATGSKEIVRVYSRSGDTFTIDPTPGRGRGQEGTTPISFSSGDLVELRLTAGFIDALKRGSIVYVIDGGGSVISSGLKGFIEAPFSGSITSVRAFADQVGSVVVDIWKDVYANYPPENTWDSITASSPVTISSDQKSQDLTLSGWTKTFSEGDIFAFNVDSCASITRLTISISVDRN